MKIKKSLIYTRTGDNGSTALVDGSRIAKNSPRLEAYGTVDELNSTIGAAISFMPVDEPQTNVLNQIQHTLFNIGAALATDADVSPELAAKMFPRGDEAVEKLEREIDRLDASLPRQKGFILPRGTSAAAMTHVARTVCRRAERRAIDLSATASVDPHIIKYLNRLSDYLFVLARHLNLASGTEEINWEK